MEQEVVKQKINSLIDEIEKISRDISERKARRQSLEEEIKMLHFREKSLEEKTITFEDTEKSNMMVFMRDFCVIAKRILDEKTYIPYSYATQNSDFFYKLERSVFENYIEEYSGMDIKTFLNYCVKLAIVKSEENKKCIYVSGKITVYYISKVFLDAAAGRDVIEGVS